MIILKMRASFGKLHGELSLTEGLNLLCMPNEAGKSTWSAFLLAMLYGIDTSQRATKANHNLPEKERYKPWDGSPMEGSVDLIWNGRAVTIERRTTGRIPMGDFSARETGSGVPIPELTGENCGGMLCGVERSVFERTAFIRQLGLSVTESPELERRLNALVTTGEEGKSASELEAELKNLRNSYGGRAGKIPKIKEKISEISASLSEIRSTEEEAMSLRAQIVETEKKYQELDAAMHRIEKAQVAKKHIALEELQQKHAAQELRCKALEKQLKQLPDEDGLHELQRKLEEQENALQTARMDVAFAPAEPRKPDAPPGFTGLSAEEAREKAEVDVRKYEKLTEGKAPRKLLPVFLSILVILGGAGLCFVSLIPGIAVAAAGLSALIAVLIVSNSRASKIRADRREAELLLVRWGAESADGLTSLAEKYAAGQEAYAAELLQHREQKAALGDVFDHAQAAVQKTIEEIQEFAPTCATVSQCRNALSAGLRLHGEYVSEQRMLEQQRLQLSSLVEVLGDSDCTADPEALNLDEAKISYDRSAASQLLGRLRTKLAELQGRISATGDRVSLEAKLEQLQISLRQAEEAVSVIDLAFSVLSGADEALRSRFSPQITGKAGKILRELTGGKYASLQLRPDMNLSVRPVGDAVARPSAAMSCGTADQMYLALRLAMCRYLLPENAPLILDDALVNFDEERCAAALKFLRKEAENRQIILFTCRPL